MPRGFAISFGHGAGPVQMLPGDARASLWSVCSDSCRRKIFGRESDDGDRLHGPYISFARNSCDESRPMASSAGGSGSKISPRVFAVV